MRDSIFPINAPLSANITLLLELGMGVALIFGAWQARQHRYRLHACWQSFVVLLNFVLIVAAMIPSLHRYVLPKIPPRLGHSFYGLATAHALIGSIAEAGALYVMLAAGTRILPERMRTANLKRSMRRVLVLWWLSLLRGAATYVRWYSPHLGRP